jgi:stearoyl-CoA desaturase (delta-9 desaturase)
MGLWSSFSWQPAALAAFLGLLVCELDQYLTTAVLHRGLTHGAIRYPPWLTRAVAIWLWVTVCIPPLTWIAAHRHHHANSDTEEDPHAPGDKGVVRVILLSWYYVTRWSRGNRDYADRHYLRPFRDDRLLQLLDGKIACYVNFYLQLGLSLVLGPVALAFWLGRLVPYMLLSGYVNAIGHTYGERPYPNLGTDARGPLLTFFAYVTGGEPLGHNFHHRHPKSPSFRPRGFDPGYWFATAVLKGTPEPQANREAGLPAEGALP